jgi:glycosyltransferase involved in cell wall biosynthesis
MKQGFIIPVYNHGQTLEPIVQYLSAFNLPIFIVDDGNDEPNKQLIKKTVENYPQCILIVLPKNGGKGKAVSSGIVKAHELGLTHLLQIDADGQHDITRSLFFLDESKKTPGQLICGYPEFDASAPASRKNGRQFANNWVKIVSLSPLVKDAMCGFRVYPVQPFFEILQHSHLDMRMGFDIEILVRMIWAGIPMRFYPVRVTYPENGTSNFRLIRDNAAISWMFTRLFFGMLIRLPLLLYRTTVKK